MRQTLHLVESMIAPEPRKLVSKHEADWRPYVEHNEKRKRVKAFIEAIRPLEKDEPEKAIELYREGGRQIVELADCAPIQTQEDLDRQGWGEQWAIRRLAMLLRRQKRFSELIEEIEAFHTRFPATAQENELQRWRREARAKLGLPDSDDGYDEILAEHRNIWQQVAETQAMPSPAFPVALVGESSCQQAIASCGKGEAVVILHEHDNPYDEHALVVKAHGDRIGYVPRDSFLKRALFDEQQACRAKIRAVSSQFGKSGVVIEVELLGRGAPLGRCEFEERDT